MHIRIALFITLSLCLLPGCQKPPQTYGNFAGAYSVDLVQDAANALYAAYPPAKTRLVLLQPVEDAFGSGLVDSLRGGGYAVAEYAPPEKDGNPASDTDAGLGFGYVLDRIRHWRNMAALRFSSGPSAVKWRSAPGSLFLGPAPECRGASGK